MERPATSVGVPFSIDVEFGPLACAITGAEGSTAGAAPKVWPEALRISLGAEEVGPDALPVCFCLPSAGCETRLVFNEVPVNFEAGAAAVWGAKRFGTVWFCDKRFGTLRLGETFTEVPEEAAEDGTPAASTASPCFDPLFAAMGCTDDEADAGVVGKIGTGKTGVLNAPKGKAEGVGADAAEDTVCSGRGDASGSGAAPRLL